MRKIKALGATLLAFAALGAVSAGASAHQWLASGKPLNNSANITVKSHMDFWVTGGEPFLRPQFNCYYNEEGTVGPGDVAEITKITSTNGHSKILCSVTGGEGGYTNVEIEAEGLPWKTELATYKTSEVAEVFNKTDKWSEPAKWEVTSSSFLNSKETNYCAATPYEQLVKKENLWVEAGPNEVVSECSIAGTWKELRTAGTEEIKLVDKEALGFE
jgi:hypothetical protein